MSIGMRYSTGELWFNLMNRNPVKVKPDLDHNNSYSHDIRNTITLRLLLLLTAVVQNIGSVEALLCLIVVLFCVISM